MTHTDTASLCPDQARSRTLVQRTLAIATVLIASLSFVPLASAHGNPGRHCAGAHSPVSRASRAALQRTVVCLIDQQRRSRGLPALAENSRLNRSAQGWDNTMVRHHIFTHGADFASRISAVGFHWSSVGENIASGFATPAAVVTAWMGSTGHCQNILNPTFRFAGTGVSAGSMGHGYGGGTWTQDFGLLMGQHAASGNWGPADGCPYR